MKLTEEQKRFISRTRNKVAKAAKSKSAPNPHWDKKTETPIGMGKDGKIITTKS